VGELSTDKIGAPNIISATQSLRPVLKNDVAILPCEQLLPHASIGTLPGTKKRVPQSDSLVLTRIRGST